MKTHKGPYQPITGVPCTCKRGIQRDNCPVCEGTGMKLDFPAIRARRFTNETTYRITDEDDLRREFWQTFPELPSERITDYSGKGKMYPTDTRCAWVDWIDALSKEGSISEDLASSATLD